MFATSIRIEDDLKGRVAAAAQKMGKSGPLLYVDAFAARANAKSDGEKV